MRTHANHKSPRTSKRRTAVPIRVLIVLLMFVAAMANPVVADAALPANEVPIGDHGGIGGGSTGGGSGGGSNPPANRPTAAVALGDSFVSGEGAEGYVPVGGRGRPIPYNTQDDSSFWCHRSPDASIEAADLDGINARFNLACSGAKPAHIDGPSTRIDSTGNPLASQLDQLEDVHLTHDIGLILIGIGSNQDYPSNPRVETFGNIIGNCAGKFLLSAAQDPTHLCDPTDLPTPQNLDVEARAANAQAIQAVLDRMDQLGYAPGDFRIVVQNFTNPLAETFHPDFHTGVWPTYNSDAATTFWGLYKERYKAGCPVHMSANALGHQFSDDLNDMVENAARQVLRAAQHAGHDVAFLDVSDAFDGDRICETADSPDDALAAPFRARLGNGVMINRLGPLSPVYVTAILADCTLHTQLCQESLHPNALGHAVLGDCLDAAWTNPSNSRIDCRRINGQTNATATGNWISPPPISFEFTEALYCSSTGCIIAGSYVMTRHKPFLGKGGTITNTVTIDPGPGGALLGHSRSADGLSGSYTVTVPCPGPANIVFHGESEKTSSNTTQVMSATDTHTVALTC